MPEKPPSSRSMGVNRSKLDEVPALALGTSPVTLLEMVNGYSTIAALGEYRQPIFITRITDKNGNVLAQFENQSQRVLSPKPWKFGQYAARRDRPGHRPSGANGVWHTRRRCGKNRHDAKKYRRLVYLDASATGRRFMDRL